MKNLKKVSRYYLTIKCRTNDKHAIHKENCPFLEEDEKIMFLGHFLSSDDALVEGKKQYNHSQCCRFCIPEEKASVTDTFFTSAGKSGTLPDINPLPDGFSESSYYIFN